MPPVAITLIVMLVTMTTVGTALLYWLVAPGKRAAQADPPGVRTCVIFSGGEDWATPEEEAIETASGEGVLREICERLADDGIAVGSLIPEEGYASVDVSGFGERLYVFAGQTEANWLVSLSPNAGRIIGRGAVVCDSALLRKVLAGVHAALRGMEGIHGVKWYRPQDWDSGNLAASFDEPVDPPQRA